MKDNHMITSPRVAAVMTILFCLAAAACSSEEPTPVYPDGGSKKDGIVWPDYGTKDFGAIKKDRGGKKDTEPKDGAVDGEVKDMGDCDPFEATCSPACGSKEFCTESAGGTCADLTALAGDPTKKEVVLDFLMSVIPCWKQEPSDSTICATLDTCKLDGDLTEQMIHDWMCDEAQILDFASSEDYDAGRDIVGCGASLDDLQFEISVIRPGQKGKVCLIYETTSLDEIFVDDCKNFPY